MHKHEEKPFKFTEKCFNLINGKLAVKKIVKRETLDNSLYTFNMTINSVYTVQLTNISSRDYYELDYKIKKFVSILSF